jgi:hypothetical protein
LVGSGSGTCTIYDANVRQSDNRRIDFDVRLYAWREFGRGLRGTKGRQNRSAEEKNG